MLTFKGGIKPIAHKYTKKSESVLLPSPSYVKIHVSSGSVCVNVGDQVKIGDRLSSDNDSHASVSGTVKEIEHSFVTIENDNKNDISDKIRPFHKRLSDAEYDDIINYIRRKGICFDGEFLAQKIEKAKDKAKILIVSCGETAPFLCSSYRILAEKKKEIIYGAKIVMKALDIKKTAITLECENKKDVSELKKMIGDSNTFQIITHNSKYPFDHPEVIRRSFNKKYLHISESKAKDEILVLSASEVTALYECFKTGIPMVTRMITVDGDTVLNPGNFIVPIGAPVSDVLESCKAQISSIKDILKGNPVSTETVSIDGHIQKDQSALIALSSQYVSYHPDDCISCGKCHLVCPMRLYPDILRESGKHSSECIGCGCCSYICPARLDFNSIYESEANKNE